MSTGIPVIALLSAISIVLITAYCARIGRRADTQARNTLSTFLLFGGLGIVLLAAAWMAIAFVFAGEGGLPPSDKTWQAGALLFGGAIFGLALWVILLAKLIRGKRRE